MIRDYVSFFPALLKLLLFGLLGLGVGFLEVSGSIRVWLICLASWMALLMASPMSCLVFLETGKDLRAWPASF